MKDIKTILFTDEHRTGQRYIEWRQTAGDEIMLVGVCGPAEQSRAIHQTGAALRLRRWGGAQPTCSQTQPTRALSQHNCSGQLLLGRLRPLVEHKKIFSLPKCFPPFLLRSSSLPQQNVFFVLMGKYPIAKPWQLEYYNITRIAKAASHKLPGN